MNQKSPKGPKSILILTMKVLLTYFWKRLPIGASIWLAPIWLISPNHATHLKSPKKAIDPTPFCATRTKIFLFLLVSLLNLSKVEMSQTKGFQNPDQIWIRPRRKASLRVHTCTSPVNGHRKQQPIALAHTMGVNQSSTQNETQ